jgi:hypothetical protein
MGKSKYSKEEKIDMACTIDEYLKDVDFMDDECEHNNCENCSFIEECNAETIKRANIGFASAIGYGGYDTEDEFWEQI